MTGHWSFTILRIVAILFALGQIWMNLALGAIGGGIYWPGMVEQIVIFTAGPVAIFAGTTYRTARTRVSLPLVALGTLVLTSEFVYGIYGFLMPEPLVDKSHVTAPVLVLSLLVLSTIAAGAIAVRELHHLRIGASA